MDNQEILFATEINKLGLETKQLENMRKSSQRDKNNLPIVRVNSAKLYKTFLTLIKPRLVLEAGTCEGYSSILTAETLKSIGIDDFRIDTVEIDEDTAKNAINNIEEAGYKNQINVIIGDSVEVFSCLNGIYDVIFLDSSKSHYIDMYPDVLRLLRSGGLLVADDIIFYGKITDLPEDTPHKHRTIVTKLRSFIDKVTESTEFTSFLDYMDDGMLIAVRK